MLWLQFFRTNDQANKDNMLGEKKYLGVSCTLMPPVPVWKER